MSLIGPFIFATLNDVIDKLERSKKRYEELQALISDPDVIRDQKRYRELRQEHASLTDLVEEFAPLPRHRGGDRLQPRARGAGGDKELAEMAREELAALEKRKAASVEKLKVLLVPRDPLDDKNVIVEIRAGTGGDEAALFAADLFRMYSYYADAQKWKIEIMSSSPTGIGGFKEIISSITGKGVYARLRYESGVHRVQRVPVTEAGGRIHTSTASVAVLPEVEETEIEINPNDLRIDVMRVRRPRRAERQHHRLRGAHHAPALGDRRALPGREEPAQEQGQGAADPARPPVRGGGGAQARRARAGAQEPDRHRGAGGEDPHVQLPAEPRDGSPHQPHPVQAGRGDEGGDRGVRRRACACTRRRRPDIGEPGRGIAANRRSAIETHDRPVPARAGLRHALLRGGGDAAPGRPRASGARHGHRPRRSCSPPCPTTSPPEVEERYRGLPGPALRGHRRSPTSGGSRSSTAWSSTWTSACSCPGPTPRCSWRRCCRSSRARPAPAARARRLHRARGASASRSSSTAPGLEVSASDISAAGAGGCGAERRAASSAASSAAFRSDLLEAVPGPFDLIASNPPYLRDDEVADMRKLGWPEPELALRGRRATAPPLAERLIRAAPARLAPGGWLVLEAAPPQFTKLYALMDQAGFHTIDVEKDLAGSDRVIAGGLPPDGHPRRCRADADAAEGAVRMADRAASPPVSRPKIPMPLPARPWMRASLRTRREVAELLTYFEEKLSAYTPEEKAEDPLRRRLGAAPARRAEARLGRPLLHPPAERRLHPRGHPHGRAGGDRRAPARRAGGHRDQPGRRCARSSAGRWSPSCRG